MNREMSYCPACGYEVEWYNDHLTPRNADYRCGNCFEGISDAQLDALKDQHSELVALRKKADDAFEAIRRMRR